MKSCLGLLLALAAFVVVIGGGGLLWYASHTAEFSRSGAAAAGPQGAPQAVPRAVPVPEGGRR